MGRLERYFEKKKNPVDVKGDRTVSVTKPERDEKKNLEKELVQDNVDVQTFLKVKDSGDRRQFETGAQRDMQRGKGRFDLIPGYSLKRLAIHFENGARKYGENNWQKGMPLRQYLDSAIRHAYAYLAGSRDEDHLAAVAWNVFTFMWTENEIREGRLPKELDDMKTTDRPLVEILTKAAGSEPAK